MLLFKSINRTLIQVSDIKFTKVSKDITGNKFTSTVKTIIKGFSNVPFCVRVIRKHISSSLIKTIWWASGNVDCETDSGDEGTCHNHWVLYWSPREASCLRPGQEQVRPEHPAHPQHYSQPWCHFTAVPACPDDDSTSHPVFVWNWLKKHKTYVFLMSCTIYLSWNSCARQEKGPECRTQSMAMNRRRLLYCSGKTYRKHIY